MRHIPIPQSATLASARLALIEVEKNLQDLKYRLGPNASYINPIYSEELIPNGDFELGNFTNFTAVNGAQTNKWGVGTADKLSGSYAAYISNNNGVSSQYDSSSTSIVHLYTDVVVPTTGEFTISFRAKIGGESTFDFLQFQVSTNIGSVPLAGGVWEPGSIIANFPLLNLTSGNFVLYQTANMVATPGSSVRLCFTWKNDNLAGVQPGAVVDDIKIKERIILEDNTAVGINIPIPQNPTLSSLRNAIIEIEKNLKAHEDVLTTYSRNIPIPQNSTLSSLRNAIIEIEKDLQDIEVKSQQSLFNPEDANTTYKGALSTSDIGDYLFVSFWAKIDSKGGTDYAHELVKIPFINSTTSDYIRMYTDNSTQIKAIFRITGTGEFGGVLTPGSNIFDDWHHFVVGINVKDRNAYIGFDSILYSVSNVGSLLTTITPNGTSKFFHSFKGQFTNLEIWNSLLSEGDVTALYNAGYTDNPRGVLPSSSLYRSFLANAPYFNPTYSEALIPNGDFELGNFTNFTVKNQTNGWFVGTANKFSGSYAAYISNNLGVSSQYSASSASISHFYADIVVPATGLFNLSFRAKIGGEASFDFLQVQASTNIGSVPVAGAVWSPGSIIGSLPSLLLTSGVFVSYVFPITSTPGSTIRLCFTWRNDSSGGTQPGAVVDDIKIVTLSVLKDTTGEHELNFYADSSIVNTTPF